MELMPVERIMGLPLALVYRNKLSSVKEAEAILKQGGLNLSMKSTLSSSQQEANHIVPFSLQ
jgi:hypothetical protein